jgi:hypothetical protein
MMSGLPRLFAATRSCADILKVKTCEQRLKIQHDQGNSADSASARQQLFVG